MKSLKSISIVSVAYLMALVCHFWEDLLNPLFVVCFVWGIFLYSLLVLLLKRSDCIVQIVQK